MNRITFLLIIISMTLGCLIIPLSSDHGDEIDKVQSQIAVGLTTREDVISILSEPDVTRDRFILYKRKEISGGAFLMILEAGGTFGEVYMDLYFEFDNYGTLIEFRADKYDKFLRSVKGGEDTPEDGGSLRSGSGVLPLMKYINGDALERMVGQLNFRKRNEQ